MEKKNFENVASATSEVSLMAIAKSGDKKECSKVFGRISFPKESEKVLKTCDEQLNKLEEWKQNLNALKAEAESALVIEKENAVIETLKTISLEDLEKELNRRKAIA